jgi:pyruvate ferredoxin oxidoreductase alpha subunit
LVPGRTAGGRSGIGGSKKGVTVTRLIEGSRVVAEAVASCRPDLVSGSRTALPARIISALNAKARSGALGRCEAADAASEAAAIAAALRAAGSGARAYTAVTSQSLLPSSEVVFNAAGSGCPW